LPAISKDFTAITAGRPQELEVGDLVLRRVQNTKGINKLSPRWEGPYRVAQVSKLGTIRLETEDGKPVPNLWSIEHLRKYHL
jgi:hypothetical protein